MEPPQAAPRGGDGLSPEPFVPLRGSDGTELSLSPGSEGGWVLRHGIAVVGVVGAEPLALEAAGEKWTGQIHKSGRGWWAEFTREGTTETLGYRPRLRSGGDLELGSGRYRLRRRLLGGWRLQNDSGGEIARETSGSPRQEIRLGPAAANEPRLAALLLASCQATIWEATTPRVGGGGNGAA